MPWEKQRPKIPAHGFRVQNFPLQLLPRPQRGTLEAAAQAGAASALVAETGAAESEVALVRRTWHGVTIK